MIKHVWLLTIVLLIAQISNLYSQTKNLLQKDYESLEEMIDQLKGRPDVFPYLNAYLEKAKKEENLDEVINGYKNYIYEVEYGQKIAYSDSVLIASELTKKNDKIGSALLTKGIVYYSGKDYNKGYNCCQ